MQLSKAAYEANQKLHLFLNSLEYYSVKVCAIAESTALTSNYPPTSESAT